MLHPQCPNHMLLTHVGKLVPHHMGVQLYFAPAMLFVFPYVRVFMISLIYVPIGSVRVTLG